MEKRGNLNREIEVTNQRFRQLKAHISKLQNWLKEEQANTAPPTLADYIQGILSRKAQAGKSSYSQSLYNLKNAANMLNFLQRNQIMDMTWLDEKFQSMIGSQMDIQDKLKPVERRLDTLKKHIEQAELYMECKGKKKLTESEQIRKSVYTILRQEQRELLASRQTGSCLNVDLKVSKIK
ncbi:MAG: hypothetical protein PHV18_08365 [Lachnospiraceae bacterium]|nr:hypothetical protein [Lachnospiraceae bacterium]